jgi:uncharacterized protein YjbI with pentapeptide repeats
MVVLNAATNLKPELQRFAGKTLYFSGQSNKPWRRDGASGVIHAEGGKIVKKITADLDYLVLCDGADHAADRQKAEKLNQVGARIHIFAEEDFFQRLAPDRDFALALFREGGENLRGHWGILRYCYDCPVDLSGADLRQVAVAMWGLNKVCLDGADLSQANLSRNSIRDLRNARLNGAQLAPFHFFQSKVHGCSLRGADLTGASFYQTEMNACDFTGAQLPWLEAASLQGTQLVFREANLSHAWLDDAKLPGADFTGANLRGANLQKTDLKGANFSGADLTNAILRQADLSGAVIDGANFDGADLFGATLAGLDATRAKGLDPEAPSRRVAPHLAELEKVAKQTRKIETQAWIKLPGEKLVQLSVAISCSGQWAMSGYRVHQGEGGSLTDHSTGLLYKTLGVAAELIGVARPWRGEGTLLLERITVTSVKCPKRNPELKQLVIAAWCEAFGIPVPGAEEIKSQRKTGNKKQRRAELLADLRSGPKGVQRWNKLPKAEREYANPYRQVDLSGAQLKGAKLDFLNFQKANFANASLIGADLDCAELQGADFRNADLSRADLFHARLQSANFEGASLKQCRLSCGDCENANFKNADLTGADLGTAHLQGADLSTANLTGTRLKTTFFDEHTRFPPNFTPPAEMRWAGTGPDPR